MSSRVSSPPPTVIESTGHRFLRGTVWMVIGVWPKRGLIGPANEHPHQGIGNRLVEVGVTANGSVGDGSILRGEWAGGLIRSYGRRVG